MADNKKSVVIYVDWISIFDELSDDEAGRLVKHLFRYVNDRNPESPDRLTKLLFEPIKQTLKRDLVKYEDKREKNKQNALKRWDKSNAVASDGIKADANHADSDSVSVSVNDIKKKYIYSEFYDLQIEENNDPDYLSFVKFLFGDNGTDRPFVHVLKMDDQIGFKQYQKLIEVANANGTKIADKVRALENKKAKGYSSFYLTINGWLKFKYEKTNVR